MSLVLRLPTGLERKLETLWRGLPATGAGRVDFSTPVGEAALISAQSVSWRVFKNPVTLFIGGVAAVILELAEPCVRTGVWEHSRFRRDPVGRLQRTGAAAMVTVYGARSIATPMIERVARMHAAISGVTPCGMAFTAADPALLTWVHATASYGFVAAYAAYAHPLAESEIDAFFEEAVPAAHLYGAVDAPRSMREVESLFNSMRGRLRRSAILLEFLDLLRAAPVLPRPLAWIQGLLIRAALDIVPPWARECLGLDARQGLQMLERSMVKSIAGLADRIVLPGGVPARVVRAFGIAGGLSIRTAKSREIKMTKRLAGPELTAIGLVALAVALRLIYAGCVELMPEEAYYWNYAQHLDIGYLDHPPMVGWLIAAGTAVFGDTEFGVRIGALLCGVIATVFVYRLTREMFGEVSGWVAVVLAQTLPFFFFAGILMTPDAPLTAAWASVVYFLYRALIKEHARAWWGVGLCLGLGLLSKYTIALLGFATLVFMLIDARSRDWLKRFEPWAAVLLATIIFSPVIVWNAHNDFASFAFQTSRRLADRPQFALPKLIGSILALLTPVGAVAAVRELLRRNVPSTHEQGDAAETLRDAPAAGAVERQRGWRFMQAVVLAPLAVFVLFSLRHEVKLDWTGAPWIASLPALAAGITHSLRTTGKAIRRAWAPTVIAVLLLYGAGLFYLTRGIPGVGYGRHAELVPVGWRELGRDVGAIAEDMARRTGSDPLIVGMDRYAIASELAFYRSDRAKAVSESSSAHLFGQVGLMYERWFPVAAQRGRQLLLIAWNPADLSEEKVGKQVGRLDPIQQGILMRGLQPIRPFYYRAAYDFH